MGKIRVAINGFGRIGRIFLRLAYQRPELEVVAINDLGEIGNLAYLLKYDSVYGQAPFSVVPGDEGVILIDGRPVKFFQERDPVHLPWASLGINVVVEATGVFESFEKARSHLTSGARRVVISAPVKDAPPPGVTGATVLLGVNEGELAACQISSNASCTTNAASPLIKILDEAVGVAKALLNTVHAYTATQSLVDAPSGKDYRRGRAAAHNIVPASTGAAVAVTKALRPLEGLFDGIAVRVPVISGSLVDVTFLAKRTTSREEINEILRQAAANEHWRKVFTVTEEPLVSSDIVGSRVASIADLSFTRVVGGDLVKVLAWYDNEMGYSETLIEHVIKAAQAT